MMLKVLEQLKCEYVVIVSCPFLQFVVFQPHFVLWVTERVSDSFTTTPDQDYHNIQIGIICNSKALTQIIFFYQ